MNSLGIACLMVGVVLLAMALSVDYRTTLPALFAGALTVGRIFWSPRTMEVGHDH